MEIFGMKVYQLQDVRPALPKTKHPSGQGHAKNYSNYSAAGVMGMFKRKYPDRKPFRQGTYMLLSRLAEAQYYLDRRPRVHARNIGEKIEMVDLFGLKLVSLKAFADFSGYSLSNLHKELYKEGQPLHEFFRVIYGGFLLSESEFNEFIAWIIEFGDGPRPRRRKPKDRRGAGVEALIEQPTKLAKS